MRIDPTETIAGLPALDLRDGLRRLSGDMWGIAYLQGSLRLPSRDAARHTLRVLVDLGYVQQTQIHLRRGWELTDKGHRFTTATAAKPLLRASADRIVQDLLGRVAQINSSDAFLYRVTKIVAFGSYLTDQARINDIDLAFTILPKEPDWEKHLALEKAHTDAAIEQGRSFSTFVEQVLWPRVEVRQFLKGRSRALQLYDGNDPVLERTTTTTIFEDSGSKP